MYDFFHLTEDLTCLIKRKTFLLMPRFPFRLTETAFDLSYMDSLR